MTFSPYRRRPDSRRPSSQPKHLSLSGRSRRRGRPYLVEFLEARTLLSALAAKLADPLPTVLHEYQSFLAGGGQSSSFAPPESKDFSIIGGAIKVEVVA